MTKAYCWLQWLGWSLLYATFVLLIINRPIVVETEFLYAAILIGVLGYSSHLLRSYYRAKVPNATAIAQVRVLIIGSVLGAFLAVSLMILSYFMLSVTEFSFPIPLEQRWYVIKSLFFGNYFNMLGALLFWSALYFAITKVRQLHSTTELLHATQLDALINQLNPHFLFNAINNIRALILEDPERSRTMLASLSEMLRYNLNSKDGVKVTLEQELAIVHSYIDLCSIQFEQRLQYQEHIACNCRSLRVPKLLLQLCVENAIKHGISRMTEGGEICIQAKIQSNMLRLIVRNHGTLQPLNSNKTGVGLTNIKQRLQLLYNGEANLRLYQQDKSVITEICLPMER